MKKNESHNEEEDLKKEAPFLFGLKKEEPFTAPDGYFEKFQSQLADKIHTANNNSFFGWILKPIVWVPSLIILITGSIFLFKGNKNSGYSNTETAKTEFNLQDVSFDVLDAYVSDHLLAMVHTDDILEITGTENISLGTSAQISEDGENDTPVLEHIEEVEIEEYLMENMEELDLEI